MKLSLPGVPPGAGARQDGLGEFAELLGARVVAQTDVRGPARGSTVQQVQTEVRTATTEGPGDVLELSWEDGIVELVSAANVETRFGASRDAGVVAVPVRQRVGAGVAGPGFGPDRGVEEFALEAVRHVSFSPKGLAEAGAFGLVKAIEERRIPRPGVHWVGAGGAVSPEPVDSLPESEAPYLVLVHGAFSDTAHSFQDLFASPEWPGLISSYPGRIVALEQHTLTDSPAKNALDLVRALPKNARVHLLTYSRGGLVGELLCRVPWRRDDAALQLFFPAPEYSTQLAELRDLAELLALRGISIERFARVACPAAGTLLASGRLDRYLNVLLSLVGRLSGVASPAFAFVKALALAIVGSRANAELFPGLEAMMPQLGKGFMPFLNASEPRPGRELAIIAGDAQGGGPFQRLKAFFTDLYFREDNDFVVDSKSMFGGVPRREAKAFYQRSGAANHFSYFSMRETRECVVDWLLLGQSTRLSAAQGSEPYGGLRAASLRSIPKLPGAAKSGGKPVVFLLPGIMGTHLRLAEDRIWISVLKLAWGGLRQLGIESDKVECDGLVERYYEKLYHHLSLNHRVEPFAFDWRRPIAEAADLLAKHLRSELAAHRQPVRLVAHSMGGLVCRAVIARHRPLWNEMVGRGGRLVMLGTPNHGSYVPAQVLTRQHSLMGWLARVDTQNDLQALTQIVGSYSGLLEMLPWTGTTDLMSEAAWRGLESFLPDRARLARAFDFRRQLATEGVDPKNMVYVAGRAEKTPDRLEITGNTLEFSYTRRGDGTVPWDLGLLDGVDTYYVDAEHGQIANHEKSFAGFSELLESGSTRKLETIAPSWSRSVADARVAPPAPQPEPRYYPQAEDLMAQLYGKPPTSEVRATLPIAITVTHGDVREAKRPVLVGHYRGDKLVSVEKVLDVDLKGALSMRHRLGMYPGEVGTSHIEGGVIVVGLGEVGQLTRAGLEQTIERALTEHALRASSQQPGADDIALTVSSLLIGTYGGTRLTIEASIEAIAEGALRANTVLLAAGGARNVRIASLELIELYDDIATEAAHAARDIAAKSRGTLMAEPHLRQVAGALRSRPRSPYASGWSQRIQIRTQDDSICYHVSTDLARSEPFKRAVDWSNVESRLGDAARTDLEARAILFRYLLPRELASGAVRSTDMVLDLDARSARLPWELLGPVEAGLEPLGVRFGILRQLSSEERRTDPTRSKLRRALVIGNPKNVEPSLDGAREEAKAVVKLFADHHIDVVSSIEKSADETFGALWGDEYDFIHIAAHGEYDEAHPENFGVVLENGRRLGSRDFNFHNAPTMVFLNCCHLGALTRENAPRLPGQLATSVAQHLIQMGVKVVVAAGWAVSDEAAVLFARTLYTELLTGRTLMDAVRTARKATYDICGSNDVTWGAYQVYGHDGFMLPGVGEPENDQRRAQSFVSAQEFIDFISDYKSRACSSTPAQVKRDLGELLGLLPAEMQGRGDIAHAVGMAFCHLGAHPEAISWLEKAIQCSEAPFETAEQLANCEARYALQVPRPEAHALFARSVARLRALVSISPSLERHSLLAATLKRWARFEASVSPTERDRLVREAREHYLNAYFIAPQARNGWYPAVNAALLGLGNPAPEQRDILLEDVERLAAAFTPPDLWSRVASADVELVLYAREQTNDPEHVAELYAKAFAGGVGATPRERGSVRDHLDSIVELVPSDDIRSRVALVRAALFDPPPPPPPISGITRPSNPPKAAE